MRQIICFIFLAVVCLAGCSDDDYSTSSSLWLTLSTDTITFDTVFTTIPTQMHDFWVYNRTKSSVRLSSVSLQRGNQTGFRVNVDGIYLGSTAGYQTAEVEIRQGDSIRVFVELTATATGGVTPQLIEDNIVFTLASGNVQQVNLRAYAWDALILDSPVIYEDITYDSSRPIIIYGTMTIDTLATVTLLPGTTLYFRDDAGMDVYGTLLSQGAQGNEVVLRGYRLDNLFDYLPYDRVSGQWQGIHLHESSYGNRLDYTDLHSAFDGIVIDSADVTRSKLIVNASTIHNCQGYCLKSKVANIEVYNSQLTNALNDCFYIDGGTAIVNNCTLAQFYPYDANRGVAFRFSASTTDVVFACVNTLITGYSSDEVQLEDFTNTLYYSFDHCVIRLVVDETVSPELFTNIIYETEDDSIAGGVNHFVEADTYNMRYDFHLVSTSSAIDNADIGTAMGSDRDGVVRDELPDIGAYEYLKPDEMEPLDDEEDAQEDVEEP